ncbi:BspA family leucine-rich repeat surface protein [Robiginitalea sp. SC105]|uniref:BspA family leucine-rich repeat surface protein n=1 Tax=Robiginitalea sp. SC105 TaxID=2762332 RepID=UPI001639A81B|nr:BspA family leucine-rich repeat surface protein [Robiginitalea sp. SC105]MBC2839864.1 DUF285 domain-containing protein [Robiginitalea sp. SC105]
MKTKYLLLVPVLGLFLGCSSDNDAISDIPDPQGKPQTETPDDTEGDIPNPIYLDANGITIKAHEWAKVGQKGKLNGKLYTIVDNAAFRDFFSVGVRTDPYLLCTTRATDMSALDNTDLSPFLIWNGLTVDFEYQGDFGSWDVSNVTDMSYLFAGTSFNEPLDAWDVSKVTDMSFMFYFASFNRDISHWDVGQVANMSGMFAGSSFNQPIEMWDVGQVTDMSQMFAYSNFNQPLGYWNISMVKTMASMFQGSCDSGYMDCEWGSGATPFNQDISAWDVSTVRDMSLMFAYSNFNQDLGGWDVSTVRDMSFMFANSKFNQDLSGWDLTGVFNCSGFADRTWYWILPKPVLVNCDLN